MVMIVKRIGVSKQQVTTYYDDINVEVPPNMSDEAVIDAIEKGLRVEVTGIDDPQLDRSMVISHEITKGGRVKPLEDNFQFTWRYDDQE